jgi:hypothetical protein
MYVRVSSCGVCMFVFACLMWLQHGFSQQAAWPDKTACVAALRTAAAELLEAAALLGGDAKDDLPYFDERLGRLSTQGYEVQHTKAQ